MSVCCYLFRLVVLFLLVYLVFIIVVRGAVFTITSMCVRGVGLSVLVTLSICVYTGYMLFNSFLLACYS